MGKKCREVEASLGRLKIKLNPVVTILSAVIIWSLAAWCIAKPTVASTELSKWTTWVTQKWTWLYIGTQDVWAVFIIVIYFSKYSNMKLGKDHEKPEYSDATYFTMLFAAGIGIGLFYFGVAEPVFHYAPGEYGNRYWGRYNDNQRAQDAINLTLFHWGVHGWIVYVMIGLLLGFIAYRNDVPMTMRSCLYPLIGNKIYGTLGDIIDTLSIVCTMFGVCTSLGLGVIQINAGLRRINAAIELSLTNQIIIIWVITAVATVSVISGIKIGIRRLSEICFALGMFIMLFVFFYDDTWFILNLYVQSCGYYLQWFIQLGFHTDAFAQLGNAPDGKEAPNWMDAWTIFYWGWWIAWSPYVGMFIARISRGRTIKQFINYTMTLPVIYTFLWFCIFGGAGLRMERDAAIANITCDSKLGGANSVASDNGLYRLSCRNKNDMWFDVITQYGVSPHLGTFMSVMSLVSLVLYFVTSSDSGSLIIDCLGSNGDPEPPVIQRIFWALTEGGAATALLSAGGIDALKALQAVSVSSGLLYTIILNFMCVALWRSLKIEGGDMDPNGPQFSTELLNVLYKPSPKKIGKVLLAIVAPWWSVSLAGSKMYKCQRWPYMVAVAVPFYTCVICQILQVVEPGLAYIGWSVLFGFFAYGTGIRSNMRERFGINGNMVEDFFAFMLLYPLAAVQMADHMEINDLIERDVEMEEGSGSGGSGESLGLKHLVDKKPNGDICARDDIVEV